MRFGLLVSLCLLSCSVVLNAESTEAYLGINGFSPSVRAELNEHDPRMYQLLQKIWGPVT